MTGILFVCTGNICRSPTADGVLRHWLAASGLINRINVESAGTHNYHIGNPPDPRTVAAAQKRGYDLSALRARQVCKADFHDFDFILAMDRGHYDALIRLKPEGAKAKIELFLAEYAPDCGYTEMPDPYYGGTADFERVLDLTEMGLKELVRRLT